MKYKAFTTLLLFYILLLTINPNLAQPVCNDGATFCWYCPNIGDSPSATYKANLNNLLLFSTQKPQNDVVGYYNATNGTEPDDKVTVIGLCRGDVGSQELCRSCLNETSTWVLEKCPTQKKAIIWGEQCMVRWYSSNSSSMDDGESLKTLESPNRYSDVGAETFNGGLKFLVDELTKKASSSGVKYASGSANVSESRKIFSLVQCMPSMSQKECSDCLNDSISKIPGHCCGGVDGARVLKPSCTLRYESTSFYTTTDRTFDQSFLTPTVDPLVPRPPGKNKTETIVISVVASVIGVVVLVSSIWIYLKIWRNKPRREKIENMYTKEIGSVEPQQFDFATIRAAIEDFSDKNRLGQGGFGPVYKGRHNGQNIAVKRLSKSSQQGDLEFKNEVKLVANLQHRNLVRLLGFCLDGKERLLIYEYVSNSSLDKFIFNSNKRANMDWDMRYKIIEGIARGIIYLHVDSNLRIIHRDLKASNIMLDENMNPKISDFGMARLFGVDQTQDNTNRIVGTYGYMAPEYAVHGHFSFKSDAFSFGVLLLEIVSGQKNNSFQHDGEEEKEEDGDLLTYAWKIWRDGNYSSFIDPIIFGCSRTEEIIRCVHIGLLCVQENQAQRPTMNSILHMLNTHSEALAEPSKPALFIESTYFGSAVMTQSNNSKSD
ncbi:cysteine-rich receptor-like protein kinase 15 [Humulus lupulus]|uniref:cysteine-rich receptor-like protein kinase 15 n=1 Tax=Humulus lupulus TaxID=3486 RepID=UPI002B40E59F|nr:cysteine-rich receptor-like protein kinase 15 [Humulus lupulus]